MTRKTYCTATPVLASALALMLAAGGAMAQDATAAAGPGGGKAPGFAHLDTDKDGKISRQEWDAPRLAAIKAMDPDADGNVTLEEMTADAVARATKRAEAMAERRFRALDADGDGKVSAAEAMMAGGMDRGREAGRDRHKGPMGHGGLFERLDADKDGQLSAEELQNARRAFASHGGRHGERGDHHARGPHGEGRHWKGPHGKGPRGDAGPGEQHDGQPPAAPAQN